MKQLIEQLKMLLYDVDYMYEMSTPRGKLKNKIQDLADPIITHIFKILLYRTDKKRIKHWEAEINNWMSQCVKTSIKGGQLTEKLLYKWMIDVCELKDVKGWVYSIMTNNEIVNYDESTIYNNMNLILQQLVRESLNYNLTVPKIDKIIKDVQGDI